MVIFIKIEDYCVIRWFFNGTKIVTFEVVGAASHTRNFYVILRDKVMFRDKIGSEQN